jgi:prophage tail gpP-like protein
MNKVELYVNGKIYDGWKDVDITRALNAVSGSFSLSITDRWSGQDEPWTVAPDDECEVRINGETVITGYVFEVNPQFEKSSRSIGISGRDKTADFVDCSADLGFSELKNISLKRLAETLAKPYGIKITLVGSGGAVFEKFSINLGESSFEVLERACRQRGYLLTADGTGGILISQPGKVRSTTILEQGKNLIQAAASFDHSERFSSYKVKAQKTDFETELSPSSAFFIVATAKDPNVKRHRPMIIAGDGNMDAGASKTRAQWEATTRAAKSSKFRCQVAGWQQGDGSLWKPNQLVRLRSSWLGIDDDLLVVSTKMNLSASSGTTTELNLERKDAYIPEPEIKEKTDPLESELRKSQAGGSSTTSGFSGGRAVEGA